MPLALNITSGGIEKVTNLLFGLKALAQDVPRRLEARGP